MSLREYLQLLRDSGWWIAAGLLMGATAGLALTLLSTASYSATTTLAFAAIEGGGEPGQAYQGSLLAEQKARSYSQLLASDRILNEVAAEIDGPVSATAITVGATAGSPVLIVQASDPSPERAARIADAVADKGAGLVSDLERPADPLLSTVVTLRVVAPAAVPTSPTSPSPTTNITLGALLGLALGFSGALVRRNLDRSVRTRESLEALTGVPLLGTIPVDDLSRSTPMLLPRHPRGQLAESVRQLRVNLRFAAADRACTSLLITSPGPGEGKTAVVCNLAAAFGLEGDKVLLLDADLRRSRSADYLGMTPRLGLTTVLVGGCQLDDAVEPWGDGLFDVLSSGPMPRNPSELLASRRTADLLAEVERRYDIVLIDAPALLPVADGTVLAGRCDATLLLVRHGRTTSSDIEDSVAALRQVSARLLGSAFTMAPPSTRSFGSHAYYSSTQEGVTPSDLVTLGPSVVHLGPEAPPAMTAAPDAAAPPAPDRRSSPGPRAGAEEARPPAAGDG